MLFYPVSNLGLNNFFSYTSGISSHFFFVHLGSISLAFWAVRYLVSPLKQVGRLQQREDEQPVPKARGRQVALTWWSLILTGESAVEESAHPTASERTGGWYVHLSCLEGN